MSKATAYSTPASSGYPQTNCTLVKTVLPKDFQPAIIGSHVITLESEITVEKIIDDLVSNYKLYSASSVTGIFVNYASSVFKYRNAEGNFTAFNFTPFQQGLFLPKGSSIKKSISFGSSIGGYELNFGVYKDNGSSAYQVKNMTSDDYTANSGSLYCEITEYDLYPDISRPITIIMIPNETKLVSDMISSLGENIQIRRFERFVLGEGLEKKNENFSDEVEKMMKK
jgi:elongation factor Ts